MAALRLDFLLLISGIFLTQQDFSHSLAVVTGEILLLSSKVNEAVQYGVLARMQRFDFTKEETFGWFSFRRRMTLE